MPPYELGWEDLWRFTEMCRTSKHLAGPSRIGKVSAMFDVRRWSSAVQ